MATSLALWVFVATRQLYLCGMGSQGEFIHTSVIRPIVIMMISPIVIITSVIRPIVIMMITPIVIITSVIGPIVKIMITSLVIITDMTPTCLLNTKECRKGNEGKGDLLVMIEHPKRA